MAKIKLAIIRQRFTPFGGAETFVNEMLDALSQLGDIEVTLITRKWDSLNSALSHRIKTHICNPFYLGRTWRDVSFKKACCEYIKSEQFHIVQSHERIPCANIYRAGDGVHKEWLKIKNRNNIVRRVFDFFSPYHRNILKNEKEIFSSKSHIITIAISRMVKANIIQNYQVPENNIRTIYNSVGIDFLSTPPNLYEIEKIKKSINATWDERILLFVGSGYFRKGLDIAIKALGISNAKCRLVVIGYEKNIKYYKDLSRDAGVEERVTFLGKIARPISYYHASDFFIFPTRYEPFSNAVLEAMATRNFPIVSTNCGAGDLINNRENGLIINSNSPHDWAKAIEDLPNGSELINAQHSARKTAEGFTRKKLSADLKEFYADILEKNHE